MNDTGLTLYERKTSQKRHNRLSMERGGKKADPKLRPVQTRRPSDPVKDCYGPTQLSSCDNPESQAKNGSVIKVILYSIFTHGIKFE